MLPSPTSERPPTAFPWGRAVREGFRGEGGLETGSNLTIRCDCRDVLAKQHRTPANEGEHPEETRPTPNTVRSQ